MDVQKEMDGIKKIIDEVLQVTQLTMKDPSKIDAMKVEEVDAVLQKVHGLIEKLSQQSERMLQDMGMTKEQMLDFVENPQNFSKEQWEIIQFMKSEADKFQKTLQDSAPDYAKEQLKKAETKRAGKKKGGPKKNWMPS